MAAKRPDITEGGAAVPAAQVDAPARARSRTMLAVVTLLAAAGLVAAAVVLSRQSGEDGVLVADSERANDPVIPRDLLDAFADAREDESAASEQAVAEPSASPSASETARIAERARRVRATQAPVAAGETAEPVPVLPPPTPVPAVRFEPPDTRGVRSATVRALKRGTTQTWRSGDQRGYVLVSEARDIDGRECRQVSYTRFDDVGQATSSSRQWCRDGRNWRAG